MRGHKGNQGGAQAPLKYCPVCRLRYGYRGEESIKRDSRFARVGGESERAVEANASRPPPTTPHPNRPKSVYYNTIVPC